MFIPGDNVQRPLFTKKPYKIFDDPGIWIIPNSYSEQYIESLEKSGIGDFRIVDENVTTHFPKNLIGYEIAEIGPGPGKFCHYWTKLVGLEGKIYMDDISPFSIGVMEYTFSVENKIYNDKNQIVIIRDSKSDPCLPKNRIKLVFAEALHTYIVSNYENTLLEYEQNCKHFWTAIEKSMIYDSKDPAKLIIIDRNDNNADVDFSPEQAIDRILKYTSLKLEATFPHTGSGGGWVAVFAKVKI